MASEVVGDHAIGIGASIAGLLAAGVLARHFGTVSVLEKDALPVAPVARRGVPQGPPHDALAACGRIGLPLP